MKELWFNLVLLKFEHRYGLSKSTGSAGPVENNCEDEYPNLNDSDIHLHNTCETDLNDDGTLRDISEDSYNTDCVIENKICKGNEDCPSLNNKNRGYSIQSCDESDFSSSVCGESENSSKSEDFGIRTSANDSDLALIESDSEKDYTQIEGDTEKDYTQIESDTRADYTHKYKHLWVLCEECYKLNYKRFLKARLYICEECGSHLKMNSSERIELLIDPDTWDPMNEKMASLDPIEFHSEEDPYIDRIDSYQKETGLTEAIQTGIGRLNGIPVAMGVMEFGFMGGSMGSVVGEKITRLIEYATNQSLPLIIVCASGGARMQEGSLSLMQMAKISSALYHFQTNQKLFYVSILTSPTTGGVTASFGMLGDIIVAEPDAYIAFAGKRVIELTLNKEVPEGSQETEYLFEKGLFDLVVPRNTLKSVLNELFRVHGFFPLNQNPIE
nr:acetyl-CoA carboxylase carboxyltransferase beta [Heptacodium miconioides]